MPEFKLHRLNYEITESQFENALRSPGHRAMKVQLPDFVEDVMAVGHTLPAGGLFLYRTRWFLRQIINFYHRFIGFLVNSPTLKEKRIESYIPPEDHIQFIYNDKTHMLSMEIVTAYERRSYRKISIIYTSPTQDKIDKRDNLLKSIGI